MTAFINIIGRLGKDPEQRASKNGDQYVSFSVAESERAKPGFEPKTTWYSCTAYGKTAEFIGNYLVKGQKVYVIGRLSASSVQEKTYLNVIVQHIESLEKREKEETKQAAPSASQLPDFPPFNEDDIPF